MLDRSTKKQLGYDTRPGHRGQTMAGAVLSLPQLYKKAVEVVKINLDQGDLKAAIFAIEQVDGKATQKLDLSGELNINIAEQLREARERANKR